MPALIVDSYVVCTSLPFSEDMLERCILGILAIRKEPAAKN
jgi:hypothetical protein